MRWTAWGGLEVVVGRYTQNTFYKYKNFSNKVFENEIHILSIETELPVREYKITNDDCRGVDVLLTFYFFSFFP